MMDRVSENLEKAGFCRDVEFRYPAGEKGAGGGGPVLSTDWREKPAFGLTLGRYNAEPAAFRE